MTSSASRRLPAVLALVASVGCNDGNITTGNSAPNATIVQPTDGSQASNTAALELVGVVGDATTPAEDLRVTWTATPGGVLQEGTPADAEGNTSFLWDAPPLGEVTIALSVVDSDGLSASSTVRVEVVGNTDPTCGITSPDPAAVIEADTPVVLQGQVGDLESPGDALTFTWGSDLDGVLDEGTATAGGVASATVTLTAGTHVLRLDVEDPLAGACADTREVVVDAAPSAPTVVFDPADPTTLSDLRAVLDTPSLDPEGGQVTYAWSWTEDGAPVGVVGEVVLAADLDQGEEWEVTVVATDEAGFSAPPVSASVVVANAPPTAPGVVIGPAGPTQALDLTCSVDVPSTDPDGDPVTYAWSWERDGAATGFTGPVVPWTDTAPGELWTCRATPSDGFDPGPEGTANTTVVAGCAGLLLDPATPGSVTVADDPALDLSTGDFTIEAWIRPTGVGTGETTTIASKRSASAGWHFGVGGLQTSGVLQIHLLVPDLNGDEVLSTSPVSLGEWNHVAVTRDAASGLATVWLDGAPVGSAAVAAPTAAGVDLTFGADATTGGLVWDGSLDDIRISDIVRYSSPFVPASQLAADADTVAWWGFEEASGGVAKDLSAAGFDGTLQGAAGFDLVDSTCANDQAPTSPSVVVTPDYPLIDEDLVCSLQAPAVDPEGATVTYAGQWLIDGAPSGQTFTTFPSILPWALTSEGEEWTCSVTASDGGQSGSAGTDAVFVGAMPIGELVVTDPANPDLTSLTFAPPIAGLLRATLDNPDASRDGVFSLDILGYGSTWVFTGYRDWAYLGATVAGWASTDVELNATPAMGTLTINLAYDETPGIDNAGIDTLSLEFVYGAQLTTAGAIPVVGSSVGPQDTTVSQATLTLAGPERLLFENVACGFGGGGHGLYADVDGVVGNDGIARVDTGFAGNCLLPLQSRPLGAGSWNLTLVNEDDFFADNTDPRAVEIYRYVP